MLKIDGKKSGERVHCCPDTILKEAYCNRLPSSVRVIRDPDGLRVDRDYDYLLFCDMVERSGSDNGRLRRRLTDRWKREVSRECPEDRCLSLLENPDWFGPDGLGVDLFKVPTDRRYAIYGCGSGGKRAFERFGGTIRISCFFESEPIVGKTFCGLSVFGASEMGAMSIDCCLVASSYACEIALRLDSIGWPLGKALYLDSTIGAADVPAGMVLL